MNDEVTDINEAIRAINNLQVGWKSDSDPFFLSTDVVFLLQHNKVPVSEYGGNKKRFL